MTSYYLLRNNQESGPFTLKELKAMPLLVSDLVWINGESTSWKNPDEIEELNGLAKKPEPATKPSPKIYTASTFDSQKTRSDPGTHVSAHQSDSLTEGEERPEKLSFDELKRKHESKKPFKKVWKQPVNIGANLVGIVTLVMGVMMAAFMIKKAVENVEYDTIVATAETHEIGTSENYISSSSQAARRTVSTASVQPSAVSTDLVQASDSIAVPAIIQEEAMPPAATPLPKKENLKANKNREKKDSAAANNQLNNASTDGNEKETEANEAAIKKAEEAEEKKPEKPNLQLGANDFKKGFLGGISNLEISVSNQGSQMVKKASVEVEFLKPNGKVINTQTFDVSDIAPNATKIIMVPDNSRGVSVRYKVVNIEN